MVQIGPSVLLASLAVSFGAIHETYSFRGKPRPPKEGASATDRNELVLFGLQQFNASIRHLLQPASTPDEPDTDKWRALTSSVIFTYVCFLQGHHAQALLHLEAGQTLLQELTLKRNRRRDAVTTSQPPALLSRTPVTYGPLKTVIVGLDIQSQSIQKGGLKDNDNFHRLAESDNFSAWRFYKAPSPATATPCRSGPGHVTCVTPDNLARAGRAAESLFNSMVAFSQQYAPKLAAIASGAVDQAAKMAELAKAQEPFVRAYTELGTAIRTFTSGLDHHQWTSQPASPPSNLTPSQHHAILSLLLYHTTLRLLILSNPPPPPAYPPTSPDDPAARFARIVDLAEALLSAHPPAAPAPAPGGLTPVPSATPPLFLVAHSGVPDATRARAVAVMRAHPRREGLWGSAFTAELAGLVLEEEARCGGEGGAGGGVGGVPEVMRRIHDLRVVFEGERRARVVLRTFLRWARGEDGRERELRW